MNLITNADNEKRIEIYSMLPKKELLDYKQNQINQIPYEERLLEAFTDCFKPLEEDGIEVPFRDISFSSDGWFGDSTCHFLRKPHVDSEEYDILYKDLVNKYFTGQFLGAKTKRITYGTMSEIKSQKDKVGHLLITEEYKPVTYRIGGGEMANILGLTKELYILQLLENGSFKYLSDKDIEEQLGLFDVTKIASINVENLDDLIKFGVIKDESIPREFISASNMILSRVKTIK